MVASGQGRLRRTLAAGSRRKVAPFPRHLRATRQRPCLGRSVHRIGADAKHLMQPPRLANSGCVGSEQLAWSGRNWRMPAWLWVGLATMFVSALHIIIDFGVGLFDLHGTLSLTEAATLVGVALIQVWWAISFMAGAQGNGSGVASAGQPRRRLGGADQRIPDRVLPAGMRRGAPVDRRRPHRQHRVGDPAGGGRYLVAVARPGAAGMVNACRRGGSGGRDSRVPGEHPDRIRGPLTGTTHLPPATRRRSRLSVEREGLACGWCCRRSAHPASVCVG
jgi:hypothetical protein